MPAVAAPAKPVAVGGASESKGAGGPVKQVAVGPVKQVTGGPVKGPGKQGTGLGADAEKQGAGGKPAVAAPAKPCRTRTATKVTSMIVRRLGSLVLLSV